MKDINDYILETKEISSIDDYITEAVNTTAFVNKIKKEYQKEFGNKVTLASAKTNYTQVYDTYIYDIDFDILKKVNDILKKHLKIWKGFTDDELKNKIQEQENFLKTNDETIDRYPIEFYRFTSKDIRKIQ